MISERAYAKVNLGLDVLGRREDGYHLVRLVMQTIDLYDSLTLEQCPEAEGEISLSIVPGDAGFGSDGEQGNVSFEPNGEAGDAVFEPNGEAGDAVFGSNGEARDAVFESGHATGAGALDVSALPTDDRNLCVRAARALLEDAGRSDGIRIELVKRIPFEAGLGGGSTDAAAVLRGVNELLHLDYTNEKLAEIGLKIGADVPYLVYGGCFLAEGIGERLTRVDSRAKEVSLLLVKPDFGAGTGGIYGAFDALPDPFHPDIDGLIGALRG
ncbi:MAG: hypothetical protein IJ679_01685, partial [Lachnospiraceae bacterium]|nr:hypothetical protein [Lachnospiraceae bacterium]